jgi:hypothetical protein
VGQSSRNIRKRLHIRFDPISACPIGKENLARIVTLDQALIEQAAVLFYELVETRGGVRHRMCCHKAHPRPSHCVMVLASMPVVRGKAPDRRSHHRGGLGEEAQVGNPAFF